MKLSSMLPSFPSLDLSLNLLSPAADTTANHQTNETLLSSHQKYDNNDIIGQVNEDNDVTAREKEGVSFNSSPSTVRNLNVNLNDSCNMTKTNYLDVDADVDVDDNDDGDYSDNAIFDKTTRFLSNNDGTDVGTTVGTGTGTGSAIDAIETNDNTTVFALPTTTIDMNIDNNDNTTIVPKINDPTAMKITALLNQQLDHGYNHHDHGQDQDYTHESSLLALSSTNEDHSVNYKQSNEINEDDNENRTMELEVPNHNCDENLTDDHMDTSIGGIEEIEELASPPIVVVSEFDHIMDDASRMIGQAETYLDEMRMIQVKNAILMDSLVMVGA